MVGNGVGVVVLILGCIIEQRYSLCFAVRCREPRFVSLYYLVRHRFPPALVVASTCSAHRSKHLARPVPGC